MVNICSPGFKTNLFAHTY